LKKKNEVRFPLYVATTFSGSATTVDYFHWQDDSEPPIVGSRTASPPPPVITISDDKPRNLAIFQCYSDAEQPDFFIINPFFIESSGHLNHYVVVKNDDLKLWNPNKFVFRIKPSRIRCIIEFSNAVYTSLKAGVPADEQYLNEARVLLTTFTSIPDSGSGGGSGNLQNVRDRLPEIFKNNDFREDVTLFHCQMSTKETNAILAYYCQC
jgi:hypothetical protein